MNAVALLCVLAVTVDYDAFISDLAGDTVKATVAFRELETAGTDAFPALAGRLNDRTIANGIFQEAMVSTLPDGSSEAVKPRIGRVCLNLIRSQVEGNWGKSVRKYYALSEHNASEWIAAHAGQSIRAMRVHALADSLDSVSQDISKDGCSKQEATALEFLVERLKQTLAH